MVYGLIDQTRNYLYLSCCSLLFFLWWLCYKIIQRCLHRILRFFPSCPLNVATECFILPDKVFDITYYFMIVRVISISWIESHNVKRSRNRPKHAIISDNLTKTRQQLTAWAYSRPSALHTAPQILMFQFCSLTIQKKSRILRSRGACGERRSAKPALNRRLSRIFFPAG